METQTTLPKTLLEAVRYFQDEDICVKTVAQFRWPNGVECIHCGHRELSYTKTRRIWKCKKCQKQFSVKVGTIFEDSPIPLSKWLPAVWMVVNDKNGISSYEMARALGVTQKTAWFMEHRIRLALQTGTFNKLSGEVEVDETYIGGKARNMHKGKRQAKGRGVAGKTAVMGLLERHSTVRTKVVDSTGKKTLQKEVRTNVEKGSTVYTDEHPSYDGLNEDYEHLVIEHAEEYVNGRIHTNGLENFWCLLDRCIDGTYVSVEPFHLFRYLDEETYRFNERKGKDADRFTKAVKSVAGKRVTWDELIGEKEDGEKPARGAAKGVNTRELSKQRKAEKAQEAETKEG